MTGSYIGAELATALCRAQAANDRWAEADAILPIARTGKNFRKNAHRPIQEHFLNRIAMGASECWYWIGARCDLGYGILNVMGEHKAHRVSWLLFCGDIPAGMKVLHRCDVRCCVNPAHLFLGTQQENIADMVAKGRQGAGQQFGEDNGQAKLTWAQVREIRRRVAAGAVQRHLCAEFGVSPMTISRIVNHQLWSEQ